MGKAHVRHFASKVAERRKRLGMTLADVNQNGGPTAPTLAKAEAGSLLYPRPSTLSKFDDGLRWVPGSAAEIYWDGGEPCPREESRHAPLMTSSGMVVPVDALLDLMNAQAALNDLVDGPPTESVLPGLHDATAELNKHIGRILGMYVTDLLERNHAGADQPLQPLIEYAFSDILTQPVADDDPDRSEKLYRRWLLGKGEDLPADLEGRFRRRLRRHQ